MRQWIVLTMLTCALPLTCSAGANTPERTFQFDKTYLNLPVKNAAEKCYLRLFVGGTCVREFGVELAPGEPDFWVFLDVSEFKGKEGVLRVVAGDAAKAGGLEKVFLDDTFPDQDQLYKETLRPQFHFSSRRGWINDTNGMVWYDGEYHMFYQHSPFSWGSDDKHWGHAISTDMVHWRELPDAIYPYELGPIWSGSAVIDHDNTSGFQTGSEKPMVCFYTTAGGTTPWSQGKLFTQSISYSNDRGRTWTQYAGNPVLGHIVGGNRDPRVFWHAPTERWVMALWMDKNTVSIFNSPDLKKWEKQSEVDAFFECPDMFELAVDGDAGNRRWVLYGASGDYFVGRFDGKRFTPESERIRFQHGNCFYASQTFNNMPDGRRVQMAWGQVDMPGMPFNQMILFPVELTLRTTEQGIRMYTEPVREAESLHKERRQWSGLKVKAGDNPVEEVRGELFHIKVTIRPEAAQVCRFVVRDTPVEYDVQKQELRCAGQTAPLPLEDGAVTLEMLVDRMSIEIFGNHGRVYMPIGVNLADRPQTLELSCESSEMTVQSLDIYTLKPIWF